VLDIIPSSADIYSNGKFFISINFVHYIVAHIPQRTDIS
jgi:hypothetical protein